MKVTKAQVSMEFLLLVSLMFLVFTFFFVFVNERILEYQLEDNYLALQDTGKTIEKEIDIALKVKDGYQRNFTLPPLVKGFDYTVAKWSNNGNATIVVNYTKYDLGRYYYFNVPPAVNISQIMRENYIERIGGIVYVNRHLW